jgi:3-deoxy-manno-octulosonate cytidylyltransferase (CMP-KDO synthetase)
MSVAILIPARYASTRFPGKPLANLTLPDGHQKSLIRLTWEAAQRVPGIDAVHVLTDDSRIQEAAHAFGASVLMTSPDCRNGTERCAEVVERVAADILVNLQGDAPLTPPWFIEALVAAMQNDRSIQAATPVLRLDATGYARFSEDRRHGRVGGTTAVFDRQRDALYFSKEIIPWIAADVAKHAPPVWHHVGVYAYTPDALDTYRSWPEGALERLEGLEQLRFLENSQKIRCVEVDARGRPFWELNNPEDIPRIEAALKAIS